MATDIFEEHKNKNDLIIKMVASGKYLRFSEGIDSFSRSYSVQWDSVNVYGRQDAIQTYQSTGETISLSWPVKPDEENDFYEQQLKAILALGKFIRPLYSYGGRILEAPLLEIRYRNLIVEDYDTRKPILCAPSSIEVNYGDRARNITTSDGNRLILPKRINISLSATIINRTEKFYKKETSEDKKAAAEKKAAAAKKAGGTPPVVGTAAAAVAADGINTASQVMGKLFSNLGFNPFPGSSE